MKIPKSHLDLIRELVPVSVFSNFVKICEIDHGSYREKALSDWIFNLAEYLGYSYVRDQRLGNLVVRLPATKGHVDFPSICLQAHLDMVPVNSEDKDFDTSKIEFDLDVANRFLKAHGTSLGADNGIGVASMIALMADLNFEHGPLELLFTVSEEVGLIGANAIMSHWIKSEHLINLDSEVFGEVTIGCAGGGRITVKKIMDSSDIEATSVPRMQYEVELKDLLGGHSGLNINEGRANAVVLMADLLWELLNLSPLVKLVSFKGGTKMNAIPSQCSFTIVAPDEVEIASNIMLIITQEKQKMIAKYGKVEKELRLSVHQNLVESTSYLKRYFAVSFLAKIINIPTGVTRMDSNDPTVVESSNNIGVVDVNINEAKLLCMYRSSSDVERKNLGEYLLGLLEGLPGLDVIIDSEYPAWQPQYSSKLLQLTENLYQNIFHSSIKKVVVHGGLECAVFAAKWPDMEMVSLGPSIYYPHSVNEYLEIETVDKFWCHLLMILATADKLQ